MPLSLKQVTFWNKLANAESFYRRQQIYDVYSIFIQDRVLLGEWITIHGNDFFRFLKTGAFLSQYSSLSLIETAYLYLMEHQDSFVSQSRCHILLNRFKQILETENSPEAFQFLVNLKAALFEESELFAQSFHVKQYNQFSNDQIINLNALAIDSTVDSMVNVSILLAQELSYVTELGYDQTRYENISWYINEYVTKLNSVVESISRYLQLYERQTARQEFGEELTTCFDHLQPAYDAAVEVLSLDLTRLEWFSSSMQGLTVDVMGALNNLKSCIASQLQKFFFKRCIALEHQIRKPLKRESKDRSVTINDTILARLLCPSAIFSQYEMPSTMTCFSLNWPQFKIDHYWGGSTNPVLKSSYINYECHATFVTTKLINVSVYYLHEPEACKLFWQEPLPGSSHEKRFLASANPKYYFQTNKCIFEITKPKIDCYERLNATFGNIARSWDDSVLEEKICFLFDTYLPSIVCLNDFSSLGNSQKMVTENFLARVTSLPLVVFVNVSQLARASLVLLWDSYFARVDRTPFAVKDEVSWRELKGLLSGYWFGVTGVNLRPENDHFLGEVIFHREAFSGKCSELHGFSICDCDCFDSETVTWHRLARTKLPKTEGKSSPRGSEFTFWEWFRSYCLLVQHPWLSPFSPKYLGGFVSSDFAKLLLKSHQPGSFILRFSKYDCEELVVSYTCPKTQTLCLIKDSNHFKPKGDSRLETTIVGIKSFKHCVANCQPYSVTTEAMLADIAKMRNPIADNSNEETTVASYVGYSPLKLELHGPDKMTEDDFKAKYEDWTLHFD